MTDEELNETIEEIDRDLEALSAPEKPLSTAERKRQRLLMMKKETLEKIKQAREHNNHRQEMHHSVDYSLICSYGEKHPLLLFFMRNKFKWSVF
jgi:hypothetical protein